MKISMYTSIISKGIFDLQGFGLNRKHHQVGRHEDTLEPVLNHHIDSTEDLVFVFIRYNSWMGENSIHLKSHLFHFQRSFDSYETIDFFQQSCSVSMWKVLSLENI